MVRRIRGWLAEMVLLVIAVLGGLLAGAAHCVEDRVVAGVFAVVVGAAAVTSNALRRVDRGAAGMVVSETSYHGARQASFVCVRWRGGESYLIAIIAGFGLVGVALAIFPEALASRFISTTFVRAFALLVSVVSVIGCALESARQAAGGYIALLPTGVVWAAFETGTTFVPWRALTDVEIEPIGSRRMLGVRVAPWSALSQPPWARPVATWNRWAYGFELLCPVDSLPIEPERIRAALRRYAANPVARQAIGTQDEFERIR